MSTDTAQWICILGANLVVAQWVTGIWWRNRTRSHAFQGILAYTHDGRMRMIDRCAVCDMARCRHR